MTAHRGSHRRPRPLPSRPRIRVPWPAAQAGAGSWRRARAASHTAPLLSPAASGPAPGPARAASRTVALLTRATSGVLGPVILRALPPPALRLLAAAVGSQVFDPQLTWDVQRHRFAQLIRAWPAPRGAHISDTVLSGVPAVIVSAAPGYARRTVVHFHGGGYCIGSPGLARAWAAALSAQAGCRVVLPLYRLAPEHPYPAALDDARGVIRAVLADSGPASVIVSGDSAGGGLALALALELRGYGAARPAAGGDAAGRGEIAGCMLLSPWLDFRADRRAQPDLVRRDPLLSPEWLEACAAAYAPPAQWADPLISPLLASHDGLPPLLIQTGTDELLAPDGERLAASASAAGAQVSYTRWPHMWHDFALQPGMLAAADKAITQAAWFVQAVTP